MEIPVGPRVPMVPQGPATPTLHVNTNEQQFGGDVSAAKKQMGGAIAQAGEVAAEHAIRFQRIQNQTEVDDVYSNSFSPKFREKYQQYYSLEGKAALDELPNYIKDMENIEKEHTAGFKTEAQRHMFRQTARKRVQMETDSMVRFADQQNKVWQAQTSDAFLRNQLDIAADKHNNDQEFGSALGTGLAEIDRYGVDHHQSGEVVRDRASKFISAAWSNRIGRALLQDPQAADRMYQENQQAIDAAVRPQLEHQLNAALKPVEARKIADGIIDRNPMKSVDIRAMLKPWTEQAEKEAEALRPGDAVFRDLTVSRVQSRVNIVATAQAGQERSDRNLLMGLAGGTPGQPDTKPLTLEALLSNDEAKQAWGRMDSFSQSALLARIDLNQKGKDVPFNGESYGAYYRLKGLASSDAEAFLNTDLSKYVTQIPHSLLHELTLQQTTYAQKGVRDQERQLNVNHALTIATPALKGVGIDPKAKPGSSKAGVYDQFVGRYTEQITNFIDENKRRPNDKELQDITNSLLTSGAESGSGWFTDSRTRAFQVPAEKFYVPVPKAEKAKIVEEYTKMKGHEPSEATVNQIYTLHSLKKGQK